MSDEVEEFMDSSSRHSCKLHYLALLERYLHLPEVKCWLMHSEGHYLSN